MAKANDLSQPVRNGCVELVELGGKKVVCAFHHDEMILAGPRRNQAFNFFYRAVLVCAPVDEEFRLLAVPQERKVRAIHRDAQANQVRDSWILAADPQAHPSAKTESCQQKRHARKSFGEKIERRPNIILLANSAVMHASA